MTDTATPAPVEIPLYGKLARGRVTLISPARLALVSVYRWRVHETRRAGGGTQGPYAATTYYPAGKGKPRTLFMHDLIMGCKGVDHEDGDPLNNQDGNLRKATHVQNGHNRGAVPGMTSAYKGVSWDRERRKWRASIQINGKSRNLGRFAVEADAARAVDAKAVELHGEFARLNLPGIQSTEGTEP